MDEFTPALLGIYCLIIVIASLVGGLLPSRVALTHTRIQIVLSAVAGLMLGVAFFHLLPHSVVRFDSPQGLDYAVRWLVVGLVVMLLLLRIFHFHQHEFGVVQSEDAAAAAHGHGGDHGHGPAPASARWIGTVLGLSLHTLMDGVALGAALRGASAGNADVLVGGGVFLAILFHKPLDAMSVTALMRVGGLSGAAMWRANLLFSLLCPAAALAFYFGVDVLGSGDGRTVAAALAFSAGAFCCIALSDLLPEVHFHSHDRVKLTTAFLTGIGLAWAIGAFEPPGSHGHEAGHRDEIQAAPG